MSKSLVEMVEGTAWKGMLGDSKKFSVCQGQWEMRPEEVTEVSVLETLDVRFGKVMGSHGRFLSRGEA